MRHVFPALGGRVAPLIVPLLAAEGPLTPAGGDFLRDRRGNLGMRSVCAKVKQEEEVFPAVGVRARVYDVVAAILGNTLTVVGA